MELDDGKSIEAFAVIVDINHFTKMVRDAEEAVDGCLIAQFVRDVLIGSVPAIESEGGEVVGFMGDALLGLLPNAGSFVRAVCRIAKDVEDQCDYIGQAQSEFPNTWSYSKGGPSVKITAEFGLLKVSMIESRLLGNQRLFIGDAINYAARIGTAREGNRCLIGPRAYELIRNAGYDHDIRGPFVVNGKTHEQDFEYFQFGLGEIWEEIRPQFHDNSTPP